MNPAIPTTMPPPSVGHSRAVVIHALPPSALAWPVFDASAPKGDEVKNATARTASAPRRLQRDAEYAHLMSTLLSPEKHVARDSQGIQAARMPEQASRPTEVTLRDRNLPDVTDRMPHAPPDTLAVVAHELRNCLMPIRLTAAQLGSARKDALSLPRLRLTIERQLDHLSRLVDDLLVTSRPGSGKPRFSPIQVDMADVLAEALDACRPFMEAREQRLQLQVPARLPALEGDPLRLVQVVRNLLENASKYSPRGTEIDVSVVVKGNALELTVTDEGIGITATVLPYVFDPFVQDPHAVAFNGAGLGIGLSVVREWVQAHGGEVVARSAGHGLGSQFVVTLPLARRAPGTNRVASMSMQEHASSIARHRLFA